jgi:predicted negative regulator of RcsB-dependent stress response
VADVTEEEQVEAIKRWFSENGTFLVVGIVVVLAVVFGYRTWETQTREAAEAASVKYEELVVAVTVSPLEELSEENLSTGQFIAEELKQDYSGTTYAHFAAMHIAKIHVQGGDLDAALKELEWVLANDPDEKIKAIANIRVARVLHGQAKDEDALAVLDKTNSAGHEASYDELRGDVLLAMGKPDEAREAYQRAVNAQINKRPMTQMKLDDLVAPKSVIAVDDGDDASTPEESE